MAKKTSKPKKKAPAKKKADPFKNGEHPLKKVKTDKTVEQVAQDPAVLNARLGVEAITGENITGWLTKGESETEASYQARKEHARKYYETLRALSPKQWGAECMQHPYDEVKKEFTDKERVFIYEYITNGYNKTKAANVAFDCKDLVCAASMGYEYFRKPHIKAEIDRLVSDRLMSKEEVLQRMSQRARASLSDYLHTVRQMVRPNIKVSLNVLIERTSAKIEDQQKFIERAGIKEGTDRYKQLKELEQSYREDIIKWVIELERNPGAYVEEKGDEVIEETIEIDMIKLAQDKERGIIKSFKRDKNGEIVIELCDADGMLRDVARYHGVFEKDNRRLNLNTVPLTPEEARTINEALDKEY